MGDFLPNVKNPIYWTIPPFIPDNPLSKYLKVQHLEWMPGMNSVGYGYLLIMIHIATPFSPKIFGCSCDEYKN